MLINTSGFVDEIGLVRLKDRIILDLYHKITYTADIVLPELMHWLYYVFV